MSGILITGTDTGVGKTLICGYLAAWLRARGMRAITQKWVQTGCSGRSEDLQVHLRLGGWPEEELETLLADLCPYCFPLPASPHLAAAREGVHVEPERIERAYTKLCSRFEIVLVEGVGGLLVPLTEDMVVADLAARLGLSALVVVRNRLGCINHALLTVEGLRSRGIPPLGLVFNRVDGSGNEELRRDNLRIIALLSGVEILGELPHLADPMRGLDAFDPIGRAFMLRWKEMAGDE